MAKAVLLWFTTVQTPTSILVYTASNYHKRKSASPNCKPNLFLLKSLQGYGGMKWFGCHIVIYVYTSKSTKATQRLLISYVIVNEKTLWKLNKSSQKNQNNVALSFLRRLWFKDSLGTYRYNVNTPTVSNRSLKSIFRVLEKQYFRFFIVSF